MSLLKERPFCMNCRHWGEMGLCRVKSGPRTVGGISWAQTVTTEPQETCERFTHIKEQTDGVHQRNEG